MKRIFSLILAAMFCLSLCVVPAIAATAEVVVDPNRPAPAQPTTEYADATNTEYKKGYVLHYMDFSKVSSWADTGYFLDNNSHPKTFKIEDGVLKVEGDTAARNGILFAGNNIPRLMQNFTVTVKLRFAEPATDLIAIIHGNELKGIDGTTSSETNTNFRADGTTDGAVCPDEQLALYNDIKAAIASGAWFTVTLSSKSRNLECFELSAEGVEGTVRLTKSVSTNFPLSSYLGMKFGKGTKAEYATVMVVAGSLDEQQSLIWPGEEYALVQTVTMSAVEKNGTNVEIDPVLNTLVPNRTVPAEQTYSYEDKLSTKYVPGYVLHNMDFSKIDSWEDTGYFVTNNANPTGFEVDDGVLKIVSDNSGKPGVMMTGNYIPKNILDFTVTIKFRFVTPTSRYLVFVHGNDLDPLTGKTSNEVNTCVRFNGTIDGANYTSAYKDAHTAQLSAMQQGEWITATFSALDGEVCALITECGGNTVKWIKSSTTAVPANTYFGFKIADGTHVEVASVQMVAGYCEDYESLTWPGEEGALVQTVTEDAIQKKVAPEKDPDDTKENTKEETTTKAPEVTTAPEATSEVVTSAINEQKSGCGAVVASFAAMGLTVALSLSMTKKRKED